MCLQVRVCVVSLYVCMCAHLHLFTLGVRPGRFTSRRAWGISRHLADQRYLLSGAVLHHIIYAPSKNIFGVQRILFF